MPAAKLPEFRRRAVDLARAGDQPVAKIASDLGINESCLRRQNRLQAREIEILKRASGYFARENVRPKG